MTGLLLRFFIKKQADGNAQENHSSIGRLAGVTGIVCNTLLFLGKLAAGLIAGSISILADAVNNMSDVASSAVTYLGFKLAQHPADEKHPYGYARCEYLSGLAVAVMIFLVGIQLAKSSIQTIAEPKTTDFTPVTFVILSASVVVKGWMSVFFGRIASNIRSASLKAASADCRNDVISTLAVILSCAAGYFFGINIDGYVGLAVAAFIFISGFGVAVDTISPLLGKRPERELIDSISRFVTSYDRILGVHDILVHDYGPMQCFVSVHAEIDASEDPLEAHDLIDRIECECLERLNVHLVIHHDPIAVNNAEWDEMRAVINDIIRGISPELSMHGFRIVKGKEIPEIVFDLALPYSMNCMKDGIRDEVGQELRRRGREYTSVIRFDVI